MKIEHKIDVDSMETASRLVRMERIRQEHKWGQQNHPDGTGLTGDDHSLSLVRGRVAEAEFIGELTYRLILEEEVFEAFAESDKTRLKDELIQVAAVALAWAEKLIREEKAANAEGKYLPHEG